MSDRVERAKELLSDPLIVEAFETLESEFTEAWKLTLDSETDKRDRLWLMLRITQRVHGHLQAILEDGRIKQKRIDELEKHSILHRLRR